MLDMSTCDFYCAICGLPSAYTEWSVICNDRAVPGRLSHFGGKEKEQ